MSKPSQPAAPDYAALAKQQGAANRDTAVAEFSLNNSNQTTPYGSRSLQQTGTDAQGNPTFNINTTLNDQDQYNLDQQRNIMSGLLNAAPAQMNKAINAMNTSVNPTTLPPMVNQVDAGGTQKLDLSSLNPSTTGVQGAPVQAQLGYDNLPGLNNGAVQKDLGYGSLPGLNNGQVQSSLNYGGLPAAPNADAVRSSVENAMFNKFNDRFQPAAQIAQDQLRTRIANMGGVTNSQGANNMMASLLRSQGDQFNQGVYDSVLNAGTEAQRQFGMGLQSRQQAQNETDTQGNFANAAQNQAFQQSLAGRQQMQNEDLTQGNFANAGQNQAFQQSLAGRQQFQNEADKTGQFYNSAQQQGFDQAMASAQLGNTARVNDANILGQQVNTNNAVNQQDVQNAFANANLNNASRSQGLTEQTSLNNMPLNQLMAILSGTQVQPPTFQNPTATNIQPAPIFQAGVQQNAANQQAYATQAGMFNNLLSGVGSIGSAALLRPSDARLKRGLRRIGRTPGGVGVYSYTIFGRPEIGVLAQELLHTQPHAVHRHHSGFLMVDYSQVR
jgi:hypothetical protein